MKTIDDWGQRRRDTVGVVVAVAAVVAVAVVVPWGFVRGGEVERAGHIPST